jgi:hypothetical protein
MWISHSLVVVECYITLEVTSLRPPSPLCSRILLVSLLFDKSIDKDVESGRNLKIMGAGSLIPVRLRYSRRSDMPEEQVARGEVERVIRVELSKGD